MRVENALLISSIRTEIYNQPFTLILKIFKILEPIPYSWLYHRHKLSTYFPANSSMMNLSITTAQETRNFFNPFHATK